MHAPFLQTLNMEREQHNMKKCKSFESYPNGQTKCLSGRLYFSSINSYDYKPSNVPHNTRDLGHFPSDMMPETADLLCQYKSVGLAIALLGQNSRLQYG